MAGSASMDKRWSSSVPAMTPVPSRTASIPGGHWTLTRGPLIACEDIYMKLKPWYDVVKPREDLCEGKSQDASEFAVHLDRVRDGTGRPDYVNPEQFFA